MFDTMGYVLAVSLAIALISLLVGSASAVPFEIPVFTEPVPQNGDPYVNGSQTIDTKEKTVDIEHGNRILKVDIQRYTACMDDKVKSRAESGTVTLDSQGKPEYFADYMKNVDMEHCIEDYYVDDFRASNDIPSIIDEEAAQFDKSEEMMQDAFRSPP